MHLTGNQTELTEPSVLSAAYEAPDGEKRQFFVNYTDAEVPVSVGEQTFCVAPFAVSSISL